MYCDRESAHVKPQQICSTRDEVPIFGKWTRKLMEEKEKDPELWGHDGFKSIYREDLKIAKKRKKKKSSTKRISSSQSESEESESESEEECSNKRRRVVKTISRSNEDQKSFTRKVSVKKLILDNLDRHNEDETISLRKKKRTPRIERKIQGLHADELEESQKKKPIKVRTVEKWGHDGFNELSDGGCSDSPKKKVKSLAVIKRATSPNIADEEKTKGVNANNEISSASSKFIDNSREKNVWRRLHDDSDLSVNRESLKNSIHGEVPKKNGRLVLSKKIERKRSGSVQHISSDDEEKYIREKKVKKTTKKKPRKYLSSSDEESEISSESSGSDSSFTESSTDERHKKLKKKRLKHTKVKHTFSDYDSDFKPKKR